MRPVDKFGNKIYPAVYNRLLSIGKQLESIGFVESKAKPNLFYLVVEKAIFYADMRGTDEVKIWEQPVPLVWMQSGEDMPLWKRNRMQNQIENTLNSNKIKFRYSFYEEIDNKIEPYYYLRDKHFEVTKTEANDSISEDIFEEYCSKPVSFGSFNEPDPSKVDGYCKICGQDIQRDTLFCDRCFKIEYYKRKAKKVFDEYKNAISKIKKCYLCGKNIYISKPLNQKPTDYEFDKWLSRYNLSKGVIHHIEYQPEEKSIEVCIECHNAIHHTNKYPELKPKPGESRRFYNRRHEPLEQD